MPNRRTKCLLSPDDYTELVAWEFLDAIEQSCPAEFEQLKVIREDFRSWGHMHDLGEGDDEELPPGTLPKEFDQRVRRWVEDHRISCEPVYRVARLFVDGHTGAVAHHWRVLGPDLTPLPLPGSVVANPLRETREEFLTRARRYYTEVDAFYKRHGFARVPGKQEYDHFTYLALHRVGGRTWQQVAKEVTSLSLHRKDIKTIQGEARKVAEVLELKAARPGRPRGSRDRTPRRRVTRRR